MQLHFTEKSAIFAPLLQRPCSSMDRIKDSGSFDWGSTPHGVTKKDTQIAYPLFYHRMDKRD